MLVVPNNGGVDGVLVEQPRERDLGHRDALLGGGFLHPLVDPGTAAVAVGMLVEALLVGVRGSPSRRVDRLVRAGEVAAAERRPEDDADALPFAEREHLGLLLAVDQVVVVLHRTNRSRPRRSEM